MSEGAIGLIFLVAVALPLGLFDLAFLSGLGSALSLAVLAAGFGLWRRGFTWGEPLDGATIGLCCGLAFALCLLGGELHVFSPTADWLVRDAVLHDLVASPWPIHYTIDGRDVLLRAPLGMYLVPAAFGKIFGLVAAHYVLFLQNAVLLAALLIIFTARNRTWRARLLILGIFIVFSGLNFLPWAKAWLFGEAPPFEWHLEAWVEWLQYSSTITQLFWVPHHALAGWGFVAAYLAWRRRSLSAWSLVAVVAFCTFWSPLAMMGALPFLCFALYCDLRDGRWRLREAIGPVLIAASSLPAIAYLMIDSGAVEKRWLLFDSGFPLRYVEFLLVELALWFWIFYAARRQEDEPFKHSDILIAAVSLLLLPLYSIGFANDFTMRASIPALAIIALAAAPRIGSMLLVRGGRRFVLAAGLTIAAITPGVEIARAVVMPAIALGNCPLPRAWQAWRHKIGDRPAPMTSYLTRPDGSPLEHLLAAASQPIAEDQPCGPRIFAFPFALHEAQGATLAAAHESMP
jgi:hypothetical protein